MCFEEDNRKLSVQASLQAVYEVLDKICEVQQLDPVGDVKLRASYTFEQQSVPVNDKAVHCAKVIQQVDVQRPLLEKVRFESVNILLQLGAVRAGHVICTSTL